MLYFTVNNLQSQTAASRTHTESSSCYRPPMEVHVSILDTAGTSSYNFEVSDSGKKISVTIEIVSPIKPKLYYRNTVSINICMCHDHLSEVYEFCAHSDIYSLLWSRIST